MFIRNKKAQGALEYLLIIGGALLIAVIALTIIMGLGKSNTQTVGENQQGYQELVDNQIVSPVINDIECSTTQILIYSAGSPSVGVSGYKISVDAAAYVDVTSADIPNRLITYNKNGAIGTKYTIKLVAMKNNLRSVPTLSFDCVVK
jgi:uncharacterized protein (UPF0333 family)